MKKHIMKNDNCVDVGCHKGEILDIMLTYSPTGKHYAFEPIPSLYKELQTKYKNKAEIFPCALSDSSGKTTFQIIKNSLAYSGIKKRKYKVLYPEIEEIEVELRTLDEIIPLDQAVHFIKIDVEGGEYGVMKGAKKILIKNKPIVIFECGQGASDFYDTDPNDLFNFITIEIGLKIYALESFVKDKKSLTKIEFEYFFNSGDEYYFIAEKS